MAGKIPQPKNQRSFSRKVLAVVAKIPKGKVLTYAEVAWRAGSQHACRAVGNILNKNYSFAIPCHRVIRSDGALGGYNRGGASRKRVLLRGEGLNI